jgi:hypothetical protein
MKACGTALFLACLVYAPIQAEPPAKPSVAPKKSPLTDGAVRLKAELPATQWQAATLPWSPDMVRQVADVLKVRERADKVLTTWTDGSAVVWTARTNPGCQVSVGVARFRDEAGAKAYCGLALDLQRMQDDWLRKASGGAQVALEAKVQTIKIAGVDEAVRCDKRFQLGPGTTPISVTTLFLRSGDLVAECCWRDIAADPAWAGRIFTMLRDSR